MNGLEESSTTPTRCHVRVVIIDGCAIVVRPVWSPCSGAGRSGLGPLLGAVTAVNWGVGHGGQQPARTAQIGTEFTSIDHTDYRHTNHNPHTSPANRGNRRSSHDDKYYRRNETLRARARREARADRPHLTVPKKRAPRHVCIADWCVAERRLYLLTYLLARTSPAPGARGPPRFIKNYINPA